MQILKVDDKSDAFYVEIDIEPFKLKFPPRPKDKGQMEYAAEQAREYFQKPADKAATEDTPPEKT